MVEFTDDDRERWERCRVALERERGVPISHHGMIHYALARLCDTMNIPRKESKKNDPRNAQRA